MMNVNVEIKGLDKITEAARHAPGRALDEIGTAIQKSITVVHSKALREAPVNKSYGGGNLRQNIRASLVSKLRGVITSRAPYSVFVHEGTRPHLIRPVQKKVLANVRTNEFFGKLVRHPGTRPNPFFVRALNNSKGEITRFFEQAIANILNTFKV